MSGSPLVSVIMPVFNGETFLEESIQSILNQTYKNIEFIIINDGSTDSSASILSYHANRDHRIKIHTFLNNRGVIQCLNKAIELSQGKYIARMDADDISLPTRLEKQVEFLRKHSKHVLVGSRIELFFGNRKPSGIRPLFYSSYPELKISSLFYCPFSHPSVMIKANIIKASGYSSGYHKVEDYELWVRLLKENSCANLEEVLLYYRMHPKQETQVRKDILLSNLNRLHQEQFDYYNIIYSPKDLEVHQLIPGSNPAPLNLDQLSSVNEWLQKLHLQLLGNNRFDNQHLDNIFQQIWENVCKKGKQHGIKTYFLFRKGFFYRKKKKSLFFFYFLSHSFFKPLHVIYLNWKRG